MTSQMKQRIIGIGVLIFLAMIILPWLFSGHQGVIIQQETPQPKDYHLTSNLHEEVQHKALPVVTATPIAKSVPKKQQDSIKPETQFTDPLEEEESDEISENSPDLTKIQNTIVHSVPDTDPIVKELSHANKVPAAVSPKVIKEAPKNSDATRKSHKESTTDFIDTKENKSHKNLHNALVSTGSKKSSTQSMTAGSFMIQLGSFSNEENVQKLLKQLKAKNYSVLTKTAKNVKGEPITRVFVGPESSRTAAQEKVKKIEQLCHVQGVVMKVSP